MVKKTRHGQKKEIRKHLDFCKVLNEEGDIKIRGKSKTKKAVFSKEIHKFNNKTN